MSTNTASLSDQIRQLREKTGAGMSDCKKALVESNGDFDRALEFLRKKGLADAAKKSARTTREGLIAAFVTPDGKKGAIVEINCETDFVAKTEEFQALARSLAQAVAEGRIASPEAAAQTIQLAITKLGENITLRRLDRFDLSGAGLIAYYVHTSGGKKGAMVELSCATPQAAASEAVSFLAKELALQIVAMSPRWVKREDVPEADIAKEKEIYTTLVRQEGKPEAAIAKIVEGKINKLFYQSFCLLEQLSMRDNKTPMSSFVAGAAKTAGGNVEVRRFCRYQLGGE